MPAPQQLPLLADLPPKSGTFYVYHDESGVDQRHDRFQLHGALFVPAGRWQRALAALTLARGSYAGRLHFVELRDKGRGHKAAVARAWFNLFLGQLAQDCYYKCMIADTQSPAFQPERFAQPYQLYNYTAALAVFGGLVWSLRHYDGVRLRVFSEFRTRPRDDDFASALPREVARRAALKRRRSPGACPEVLAPIGLVRTIAGDPARVPADLAGHCEFIQLTDLLTGAVAQALNARAQQRVKLDLAAVTAGLIEDTRRPPWRQDKHLHRRFSVSCFPNARGGFYNVPLGISARGQPPLEYQGQRLLED